MQEYIQEYIQISKYDVKIFKYLIKHFTMRNIRNFTDKIYKTKANKSKDNYIYFFMDDKEELIFIMNEILFLETDFYNIKTIEVDKIKLVNIPHTLLEPITKDTFGNIVYLDTEVCSSNSIIQPLISAYIRTTELDKEKWGNFLSLIKFYKADITQKTTLDEYMKGNPVEVIPITFKTGRIFYTQPISLTLNRVDKNAKYIENIKGNVTTIQNTYDFFKNQEKFVINNTHYGIYKDCMIGFLGDVLMSVRLVDLNCEMEIDNNIDKVFFIKNTNFSPEVKQFIDSRIFIEKLKY